MDVAGRPRSGATSSRTCASTSAARRTYWYIGDQKLYGVGAFAQARWPEFPPSHPKTLAEAFLPAVDAKARLGYMDEVGVYYQVMYPNILGFHSHVFLQHMPQELATECVRAYNDWLAEWCSADSKRLIPMMMLPFWDIDASVAEMKRAYDLGHKGVLFAARYDKVGLPRLVDDYWEPLLGQAQEMGLSMNFHVGFLSSDDDLKGAVDQSKKLDFTRESSLVLLGNAQNVAEVVLSGVCHRYPDLNFVSVENGAGLAAVPRREHGLAVAQRRRPQGLPGPPAAERVHEAARSTACTGSSRSRSSAVIDEMEDNLMFETDFPHATSLSPGPASESPSPRDVMERSLGGLDEERPGQGAAAHRHQALRPRAPDPQTDGGTRRRPASQHARRRRSAARHACAMRAGESVATERRNASRASVWTLSKFTTQSVGTPSSLAVRSSSDTNPRFVRVECRDDHRRRSDPRPGRASTRGPACHRPASLRTRPHRAASAQSDQSSAGPQSAISASERSPSSNGCRAQRVGIVLAGEADQLTAERVAQELGAVDAQPLGPRLGLRRHPRRRPGS